MEKKIFSSYYDVLQVSADARQEDIARAYRTLVKKYHPDTNPAAGSVTHNRLKVLKEAYEALKTPAARAEYDMRLKQKSAAWNNSLSSLHPKNDNAALARPFPWRQLALVGWSNLARLLIPLKRRKGGRDG